MVHWARTDTQVVVLAASMARWSCSIAGRLMVLDAVVSDDVGLRAAEDANYREPSTDPCWTPTLTPTASSIIIIIIIIIINDKCSVS